MIDIQSEDMKVIEEIARKYNLSMVELGNELVMRTRKRAERQFKLSESEYEILSEKAEKNGCSVAKYCEFACNEFLKKGSIGKDLFAGKGHNCKRTRRITVRFSNIEEERKLVEFAERYKIKIGTLLRYCALKM